MENHGSPMSGFPVPYPTPGRDVNRRCDWTHLVSLSLTSSRCSQNNTEHTTVILVSHWGFGIDFNFGLKASDSGRILGILSTVWINVPLLRSWWEHHTNLIQIRSDQICLPLWLVYSYNIAKTEQKYWTIVDLTYDSTDGWEIYSICLIHSLITFYG